MLVKSCRNALKALFMPKRRMPLPMVGHWGFVGKDDGHTFWLRYSPTSGMASSLCVW